MTKGLSRNSDPDTSHAAGESSDRAHLERMVFDAVAATGAEGMWQDKLCETFPYLDMSTVTPRISPLKQKGLIVDTGYRVIGLKGKRQLITVVPTFLDEFISKHSWQYVINIPKWLR